MVKLGVGGDVMKGRVLVSVDRCFALDLHAQPPIFPHVVTVATMGAKPLYIARRI